jgi:SAM-dependent methyltransferase
MAPPDPAAFDPLASGYDDVALSALGVHYRRRVDQIVDRHLPPNARILDVGCGTGIDAARLVAAGHEVIAVDGSAEMVAKAAERFAGRVEVRQQDVNTIDQSDLTGPFDLVLANFGVVNCCNDLPRFGRWLASAIDQSGLAILVTMAPICPPELLQGLLSRNRSLLRRRRPAAADADRDGDMAGGASYVGVPVRYLSAKALVTVLGADLVLEDARALGVVLPTFEQRRVVADRPGLLRWLGAADRMLGSPMVDLAIGDHHVAVIGRKANR